MKKLNRVIFFAAGFFLAGSALALEFKTVGAAPVILYDAPSNKGAKIGLAPRGMPVELILTYGTWSKVRDATGELSWVESKDLIARRNVIVRVANVKVRAAPDESSVTVITADKHVLLELAEIGGSGWIKVKHRDGAIGYVRMAEVWGI